jgi:hypothetical protein
MHTTPATPNTGVAAPRRWSRRFAAIAALAVPVAMVVVASVSLAGDVPIAVLAVVLVLAANAGIIMV